ncbi:FAD-binding protein [Streptomyces sp. NBC_01795]|uniref:FAD-binding oxidoreductase n=1 Tax=Streptomyces sp. NBC_01795 TaxID=2975943 RepID=UPI002DD99FF3|nr:FAD-linked oxidase C-terminal domain-containing protein [Streptomyces sp. NBC_01795]WSA96848.1 FAD-binding protein [Streptomyces sp. NBC_01795]
MYEPAEPPPPGPTDPHPAPDRPAPEPGPADAFLGALREALGPGLTTVDADVLETYRTDSAPLCASGTPLALVRPRSTEDVVKVMRLADRYAVPVVPQGARTGLAGGANAVEGCVLLSLERMNAIVSIDPVNQTAVVQPGVVNADFSRAVAEQGLHYPPDPASWESSTLGGNVATNAGGLCCVKYGVTTDFVLGLEVVLADGDVLRTGRRTVKGVAGYDLTRLFVGSEGTLGVVTEITLRLVPPAQVPLTAVAFFPAMEPACDTVTELMRGPVRPSLLEIMDRPSVDAVGSYRDLGFPADAQAVLMTQSDRGPLAPDDLRHFEEVAARHGGEVMIAADPAEGEMLLAARRLLAPALERLGAFLSDDVCVPRSALTDLVSGVAGIAERHRLLITCSGHAGDGNMHPTVVFDRNIPEQVERAQTAFEEIMSLGLELGGTITGEHGVGTLKAPWLERELGPVGLRVQRDVKRLFDPKNLINPGKVLAR